MPFTLAHPAAVMPLRRYCPRWLSFPALVIGSLTPDAGYLFGEARFGSFTHRFLGSLGFCLPVGLLLVALFYGLRSPLVSMLPATYQRAFLPLCRRPAGSIWAIVISLLIGAWTHQAWDSFTHTTGWCVQHVPLLRAPLISVAGRTARVCHVLWYGCSFAGVVWLFLLFERWKQTQLELGAGVARKGVLRDAVLVALLVLPIELVHHLVRHNKSPWYLLAALCALPAIGIGLKAARARKAPAPGTVVTEGRAGS